MPTKPFNTEKPDDILKYIELALDNSNYKNRLIAIKYLSKFKCSESVSMLYKIMSRDKIFEVKEQAFRALQNFGENVRLTKKGKGKTVKTINDKLLVLHNSFNGDSYSLIEYKQRFRELYPDIFDIYNYEKKSKFDEFVTNSIKGFPGRKIKHNYSIFIKFKDLISSIQKENIEIDYQNLNNQKDELIVEADSITINCYRPSKINLINIVLSDTNAIHNQIIKSLIYYYLNAKCFNEIEKITLKRLKTTGELIVLELPSSNILLEQILSPKFNGINLNAENLKELFENNDKATSLQLALTYLLKSKITEEPSSRFEKLWKSFNSIYYYFGNGSNENECHILIKKFLIDNKGDFTESLNSIKNLTIQELKQNVRIAELLQNDYNTKDKTVSFIAFIHRYTNNLICRLLFDNLVYQESYLKGILTVNRIESRFNKFDDIKSIYYANKNSSDREVFYKTVHNYLEEKIKNPLPDTEIEIIAFICIKYGYFMRNKIFHAEKQDLTFRIANMNIIKELSWLNNILESFIIDLLELNKIWEKSDT